MHLVAPTPAVLRLRDGSLVRGKLKVVSLTGGLLSVPHPIDTGSNGRLVFLTAAGSVMGSAEMLGPISWGLQPFRFVALQHDDQKRLRTAIDSSAEQKRTDQGAIERSRPW
jgi:hypothetical protein